MKPTCSEAVCYSRLHVLAAGPAQIQSPKLNKNTHPIPNPVRDWDSICLHPAPRRCILHSPFCPLHSPFCLLYSVFRLLPPASPALTSATSAHPGLSTPWPHVMPGPGAPGFERLPPSDFNTPPTPPFPKYSRITNPLTQITRLSEESISIYACTYMPSAISLQSQ